MNLSWQARLLAACGVVLLLGLYALLRWWERDQE
jgi:hypothetical protein